MFKLFAFFALLACALCAPAPTPKPGIALSYAPADIPLSNPGLIYARSYAYNNLGYAYTPYYAPANYYYNAPLAYAI